MKAGRSFETIIPLYKTTRTHIPEDCNAHTIFFEVNKIKLVHRWNYPININVVCYLLYKSSGKSLFMISLLKIYTVNVTLGGDNFLCSCMLNHKRNSVQFGSCGLHWNFSTEIKFDPCLPNINSATVSWNRSLLILLEQLLVKGTYTLHMYWYC
jgi:hypothetical protein